MLFVNNLLEDTFIFLVERHIAQMQKFQFTQRLQFSINHTERTGYIKCLDPKFHFRRMKVQIQFRQPLRMRKGTCRLDRYLDERYLCILKGT